MIFDFYNKNFSILNLINESAFVDALGEDDGPASKFFSGVDPFPPKRVDRFPSPSGFLIERGGTGWFVPLRTAPGLPVRVGRVVPPCAAAARAPGVCRPPGRAQQKEENNNNTKKRGRGTDKSDPWPGGCPAQLVV